jgi:hypothetical protein
VNDANISEFAMRDAVNIRRRGVRIHDDEAIVLAASTELANPIQKSQSSMLVGFTERQNNEKAHCVSVAWVPVSATMIFGLRIHFAPFTARAFGRDFGPVVRMSTISLECVIMASII